MKGFLISTLNDFTVGLKFNEQSGKLTIGGNIQFSDAMKKIMIEYFDIDVKGKLTARNKIKFCGKCTLEKVSEVLRKLRYDEVIFKPVKTLERIWW